MNGEKEREFIANAMLEAAEKEILGPPKQKLTKITNPHLEMDLPIELPEDYIEKKVLDAFTTIPLTGYAARLKEGYLDACFSDGPEHEDYIKVSNAKWLELYQQVSRTWKNGNNLHDGLYRIGYQLFETLHSLRGLLSTIGEHAEFEDLAEANKWLKELSE